MPKYYADRKERKQVEMEARMAEYERLGMTDAHVFSLGQLESRIDRNYQFIPKNPIKKFCYFLFHSVVMLLVPIVSFVAHGTKIVGRRNIKCLKGTGAISVSNHVLMLDSLITAQCWIPRQVYFPVLEGNVTMPFVGGLVKSLGGLPIPSEQRQMIKFTRVINELLKNGKIVHIMAEGSLWPYYDKIRKFQAGAFHFAVKSNVPVVPICINFRQPSGLRKLLGIKAKLVTVHIGKPIYMDNDLPQKEAVIDLLLRTENTMRRMKQNYKLVEKQYIDESDKELNKRL